MRCTGASLLVGAALALGAGRPALARSTTQQIGVDAQRAACLDRADKPDACPQ